MAIEQIHKAVHRIRTPFGEEGIVYLHLLKGDRTAIIDTGVAQSPRDHIEPALTQIGMALSDVDVILNTHAHPDHSGGNMEIKRASNASIYVHSADLPRATSSETLVEYMMAPSRALGAPPDSLKKGTESYVGMCGEAAGADVVVAEGDIVDLGAGIELRVVHFPGHTPGSVAYFWESEGMLFTGDCLLGYGSRLGGYPGYRNAADYRRSLQAASQMDIRLLCLGHGYLATRSVNAPARSGEDIKQFLKDSIHVVDTMHRVVSGSVRRLPGATKKEIAADAMSELIYELPTRLDRQVGLPANGIPTLLAHIEAALEGSYPG